MIDGRLAALPMYDFPALADAHDRLWLGLVRHLEAAGVPDLPTRLRRDLSPVDTWVHPRLLLSQACEYPLAKTHGRHVRCVATPRYSAPGCDGFRYRSAIVVRRDDPAAALGELKGRRCAVNEMDSNSGMNLLRARIAPLAGGRPFFASVQSSGSHAASARLVADGGADVAALDCVTFAHLRRMDPSLDAALRVLAWTAPSPSLPLVTARAADPALVESLRAALAAVSMDPALRPALKTLALSGFDCNPDESFAEVLRLERGAAALGYPVLA
jgi:ABC-type phosphate/phosphonate transport system substrate-binding protein